MLSEELIKQNHEICLELLDKFIEVCNDNNITYYISEGSAIGVMRHHGFIPWDINVDVIMTVEEFNKLDVIMKKLDTLPPSSATPSAGWRACPPSSPTGTASSPLGASPAGRWWTSGSPPRWNS